MNSFKVIFYMRGNITSILEVDAEGHNRCIIEI